MQPYGGGQPYQPHDTGQHTPPAGRIRLGDLLTVFGGLFVFAFSFAPFVKYPNRAVNEIAEESPSFDGWYMAWSTQMFMAPLTWWVIFAGIGVVALTAVRAATARDPEILRFRASQLQVFLGLFALLVLFGYAVSHKQIGFGLDDLITDSDAIAENDLNRPVFGWGGYLMMFGALFATVGAVLNHLSVGPLISTPAPARPVPPGYVAPSYPPPGYEQQPYPQQGYQQPPTGAVPTQYHQPYQPPQ
jgi:hypothetical protein